MANRDFEFPKELLEAVNPPPGGLSPERMLELDLDHAERLFTHDFDAMREKSFIETPIYENFPQGVRITGLDAVRAMHQGSVLADPTTLPTLQIRSVAFGHNVLVIEWSRVHKLLDGTDKRCYAIAVVPYEGEKLVGERVYRDHYYAELSDARLGADFYKRPDVELL